MKKFDNEIKTLGSDKAIDGFFATAIDSQFRASDMANMKVRFKEKFRSNEKNLGKPLGMEVVEVYEYTPTLQKIIFLQSFSQGILAWNIYFYKPGDKWIALTFNVTDDPEKLDTWLK